MTYRVLFRLLRVFLFAPIAACSCGENVPPGGDSCVTSADCASGETCVDGVCRAPGTFDGGPDTGSGMDAGGPECRGDAECAGGVCVSGACCATDRVCGSACCGDGDTCFANACVFPGDVCRTSRDCADGEYCEPSLGEAPAVDAGMPGCAAATTGRCLALPPRCDMAMPGEPCITDCEYHPPVGMLTAEVQWTWRATEFPEYTDVWATPTVGRLTDTNCDGAVDELDPPNVVFVSGFSAPTQCAAKCLDAADGCPGLGRACRRGVLRVLDGLSGAEVWSLDKPNAMSRGFMGNSVALGDLVGDERLEIAAISGEGRVVIVGADGTVLHESDTRIPGWDENNFGWGGGLAIADMNGDGDPEIAYGATVYTTAGGALAQVFSGTGAVGGSGAWRALSTFVDLDADLDLELLAGATAYEPDGTMLWNRRTGTPTLPDGFPAAADLDGDGAPEAILVASGDLWVLEGSTGATELGPVPIGGAGTGGPPTVADFDGDGAPEIGVAQQDYYFVFEPDFAGGTLTTLWQTPNHDYSSSVTGSTVFDFEGDGIAEVIYNDECFLWVYDGPTGAVRFAAPTTSFTATEASLVADVDGDGHAEMLMISNGADPVQWHCRHHDGSGGLPAWDPPPGGDPYYRGLTLFRDAANSWVGTRPLWNQHTYHVSNVCDENDTACMPAQPHGAIPTRERKNWTLSWLNNFRQNVQEEGIFDAPDATVELTVRCTTPLELEAAVRNLGEALLPAGVEVGFYVQRGGMDVLLGTATTATALFPGQVGLATLTLMPGDATADETFVAKILIDPTMPTFHECRDDNNESEPAMARCLM